MTKTYYERHADPSSPDGFYFVPVDPGADLRAEVKYLQQEIERLKSDVEDTLVTCQTCMNKGREDEHRPCNYCDNHSNWEGKE